MPAGQIEQVGPTGIYPVSGPHPKGPAEVRGQGELAHPEERRRIEEHTRGRSMEAALLVVGLVIFGGYFCYSGIRRFLNPNVGA